MKENSYINEKVTRHLVSGISKKGYQLARKPCILVGHSVYKSKFLGALALCACCERKAVGMRKFGTTGKVALCCGSERCSAIISRGELDKVCDTAVRKHLMRV